MQSHIVSNHWISIHRVADVAQISRLIPPLRRHTLLWSFALSIWNKMAWCLFFMWNDRYWPTTFWECTLLDIIRCSRLMLNITLPPRVSIWGLNCFQSAPFKTWRAGSPKTSSWMMIMMTMIVILLMTNLWRSLPEQLYQQLWSLTWF